MVRMVFFELKKRLLEMFAYEISKSKFTKDSLNVVSPEALKIHIQWKNHIRIYQRF